MSENDIVADIIQRLAESLGAEIVPPEVLMRIEVEIRRDWAGDTVYVKANRTQHRNDELLKLYAQGYSVSRLSARFGITSTRVRQIINKRRKT